jgi:carboxymethylenebutenolidase
MRERTVSVTTPDGPIDLYEAAPDDAPRGGIVVIQEAFGVNEHIRDVTRRFVDHGYVAVAPALFHRTGSPELGYGSFEDVLPHMKDLSDDGILADVDAAIDHLRSIGVSDEHIGIVGFCFGGRVTFLVAARRKIGAAVGFYGGGIVKGRSKAMPSLVGEAATLQTPWLGLFGDKDKSIPPEDVEKLRAALDEQAPVDHDVVRYAEAGHGFHCDVRDSYHPDAAADGWERTIAGFDRHL